MPHATLARRSGRSQRDELIEGELGLAERIAADYGHRGVDRDDLRQVAFLGLVKAADRFEPDRGTRFSVFASSTINGEIKRHFRDQSWSVRPPRSIHDAYLRVRTQQQAMVQELGREPTVEELSERTDLGDGAVRDAIAAQRRYRSTSISAPQGEQDDGPRWEPSEHEDGYGVIDDRALVAKLTECLTSRERRILRLRFVDDMTQSDIAQQVGVSQVQISRLLRSITSTLRCRAERGAA